MTDFQGPERLLQGMTVGQSIASANGVTCYELEHAASGQRFVLKHVALPASEEKLDALILSGAYADREEAGRYYQHMAEDLVREIRCNRALSECPNILRFLSYQLVPREGSVGFDLYTITARQMSLREFRSRNAMSHLMALNLGIDICTALEAIHAAGFVFQDLRPGNVFLTENGRFLLGDFGLAPMQDMQFSSLPEQFMSEYSAPELGEVLTGLNETIDIYSLGMLLYRIYNGFHAPFEDEDNGSNASEERRRAGEALPAPLYADYEMAGILSKACAFRPEDRYQTPAEFREALIEYMRRNEVSDELIVPPIVSSGEPMLEDMPDDEPEPVRIANVEELDEDFKAHFSPDTASLNAVISAVRKEEARTAHRETPKQEPPAPPAEAEAPAQPAAEQPAPAKPEKPAKPAKPSRKERKAAAKRGPAQKKKKYRRMRRKGAVVGWIFGTLLALIVAAVLLYCFTPLGHDLYEFDIVVRDFAVTQSTTDSITVRLDTNAEPGLLTAQCQDAYGNAVSRSVEESELTFTELTPGTQYTVNLSLSGFHRLSGTTSVTVATDALTEVLTFAVTPSPEEGAAAVSLVLKDGAVEPEQWQMSIEAEGEEARTQSFTGHSVQIAGLTVGKEYTFRLLETEDLSLVGQTEAVYTPLAVIEADGLALTQLRDGTATVSWRCTSELPETWQLACEGPDGEEQSFTLEETERAPEEDGSYRCSAQFDGIEPGSYHLFRVDAEGMFQSLTCTLDENTPYVDSFTAEVGDRTIDLSWNTSYTPDGGWTLLILQPGEDETPLGRIVVPGNSYTLEYQTDAEQPTLLPNTDYRFVLSAGPDVQLLGYNEVEARSGALPRFSGYSIDIMTTHTGLYRTPEAEEWDYETLLKYDPRTSFSAGDSIEMMLRNRRGVDKNDAATTILFVIRDGSGKLIYYSYDNQNWNEMWGTRHWVHHLPMTPQDPGSYTLEVYLNYQFLYSLPFTITE